MQQSIDLSKRRLGELLKDISERCSLITVSSTFGDIDQWVTNNHLTFWPDTREAASFYDLSGPSPTGDRLREEGGQIRNLLTEFLFPGDDVSKPRLMDFGITVWRFGNFTSSLYRSFVDAAKDASVLAERFGDGAITSTAIENGNGQANDVDDCKDTSRGRRAVESSGVQSKIVAALVAYHEYDAGGNGSCMNCEPIGVRQLAKLANVSPGSVTPFFQETFNGHANYKVACQNGLLAHSLAMLNGDLKPGILFKSLPDGADKWLADPAS